MAPLTNLPFDNTFARLDPAFYEVVEPTPLTNPYLVAFNSEVADLLDLDPTAAADPDFPVWMSGGRRLPGSEPIAMIYAGHQFGVWVPQLGDGRAILLGELVTPRGERWDLHLKGSGQTRFSRMGDGRAVLRSTIREYLAGEALHGLGIPTTRALCIVGSDEPVYREAPETAATLIRVAPSHVRFGTFQIFAARGQPERVKELADYVITHHANELVASPERFVRWLERVVVSTAELMARWMAAGFAHGVMNTDNMSVLGLTLDYGPFGFLDEYDAGFIPNHSDPEGRYAFDRQPAIGLWNLARFGESLLSLVTVEQANLALELYAPAFADRYAALMRDKLGLRTERSDDARLVADLLALMQADRIDYTRFFRSLGETPIAAQSAPATLRGLVRDGERLDSWLARYEARLRAEVSAGPERGARMRRANPKFILRNHLAQRAIELAQRKDFTEIERLRAVLRAPFDEHPDAADYAGAPPVWAKDLIVSCSS